MLSDVAASQIARHRNAARISHRELAERCKRLGLTLSASAISDIESGRRDEHGQRRREIRVDELTVLARALDVSPVLLLAPLGYEDQVEILPGQSMPTIRAYEWLTGERPLTGGHDGGSVWFGANPEKVIGIYKDYEKAVLGLFAAQDDSARRRVWADIRNLQESMRSFGWRIPPLPGDTTDDQEEAT